MAKSELIAEIERALAENGIYVAVEDDGRALVLNGEVQTDEQRQAAQDVVARLAEGRPIDNALDVMTTLPDLGDETGADEDDVILRSDPLTGVEVLVGAVEPDFSTLPDDTVEAVAGADDRGMGDPNDSGADPWIPPTDPVIQVDQHGRAEILNGFSVDSLEEIEVARSVSDDRLGDGAISDAIRRELREDATTTDLQVDVEVRQGVAHLHGRVPLMEDAENAEAVAARVPGVREVREELDVETI